MFAVTAFQTLEDVLITKLKYNKYILVEPSRKLTISLRLVFCSNATFFLILIFGNLEVEIVFLCSLGEPEWPLQTRGREKSKLRLDSVTYNGLHLSAT